MALTPLNSFTTKTANFADRPNSAMSAAQVKAQFDAAPEELRVFVNSLITQLNADFALKSEIASALLGQILDGSLTDAKLSNTAGQAKDRLSKVITDLANFIATKGLASGLAPLDSASKVPRSNLPTQTAKGTIIDTSTVIGPSANYTKTIPIGLSATKGRLIFRANGNSHGAIIFFSTVQSDSMSYDLNSTTVGIFSDGQLTNRYIDAAVGKICIQNCYISGSNLIIVFNNSNTANTTLTLDSAYWEVEA